jgi:hypothetical protein
MKQKVIRLRTKRTTLKVSGERKRSDGYSSPKQKFETLRKIAGVEAPAAGSTFGVKGITDNNIEYDPQSN